MPKLGKGITLIHKKKSGVFLIVNKPYKKGIYGKRYNGYFDDNVNWFATAIRSTGTPAPYYDEGPTSDFTSFSSSADALSYDMYSWQWLGYFKPPYSDTYTFTLQSDDASYIWIGDKAITGFTTSNATVNNGGLHGYTPATGTPIYLVSNIYYPVRIQYGENTGGDRLAVSYRTNTNSTQIYDFTDQFYHLTTQDFAA